MTSLQKIEVAQAEALVRARMPTYAAREVPVAEALGCILRETIHAERDQPPFDRVTMDGIAIRYADFAAGRNTYKLVGTQGAGAPALKLGEDGHCVEIMTGAVLPVDADTVVPVERIRRAADMCSLEDDYRPNEGQFVHLQASDYRQGQVVLKPGMRIGPPEMAVLTIGGKPTVEVAQWPRVAVISTGDELVEVGVDLAPFQIRSSNGPAIAAALESRGCRQVTLARLPDDPKLLRQEISQLHDEHDVLILSGGVSMGKYDYVPQVMGELDVELVFHKILQRPGLPMWFGVSAAKKPVFALPGNPVSSLVCMLRYAVPAILESLGLADTQAAIKVLAEDVEFASDLTCFLPVALQDDDEGQGLAVPRQTNTSGDFVSLAGTDGFLELPRGQDKYPAGFAAAFYPW